MPFIAMGEEFKDTQEGQNVPEGQYDLVAKGTTLKYDGETLTGVSVTIEIVNPPDECPEPNAIFHHISIPKPDDDTKKKKFKNLLAQRFFVAFGVDYTEDGFDPDDIPGSTASNILCKNGAEYPEGSGNFPTNMSLPRLPENSAETAQPSRRRRRA